MNANPIGALKQLYVLMTPASVPYMGTDGRLELFTDKELAMQAVALLMADNHVHTNVQAYETPMSIRELFRYCMHNGMVYFRLDNGSENCHEYKFDDLFSYREPNLIEETNRIVRYYLMRSRLYNYCRGCIPEEEHSGKQRKSLMEFEMTMRYNAYREMYNGLLYALANPADHVVEYDYYTPAALELAQKRLKSQELQSAGFTAVSLIHKPHQGGALYTAPLQLCYVNRPGQVGSAADGIVCAFTTYAAAEKEKALFRSSQMPCDIVAITAQELMAESMQCSGVLIDMTYEIVKEQFEPWKTYGEMNHPIVVKLSDAEKAEAEKKLGGNNDNMENDSAVNADGNKANATLAQEVLDDASYIADSRHTAAGAWQQYDYLLAARGYGWDYMVSQAAYMTESDLEDIGTITVSEMANTSETELISEYHASGNRIEAMPSLKTERGVLSIGGMSRSLQRVPVKIVWFNQTRTLRIFTILNDEELLLRYVETVIRRTFNTPDAMKLAKTAK